MCLSFGTLTHLFRCYAMLRVWKYEKFNKIGQKHTCQYWLFLYGSTQAAYRQHTAENNIFVYIFREKESIQWITNRHSVTNCVIWRYLQQFARFVWVQSKLNGHYNPMLFSIALAMRVPLVNGCSFKTKSWMTWNIHTEIIQVFSCSWLYEREEREPVMH